MNSRQKIILILKTAVKLSEENQTLRIILYEKDAYEYSDLIFGIYEIKSNNIFRSNSQLRSHMQEIIDSCKGLTKITIESVENYENSISLTILLKDQNE